MEIYLEARYSRKRNSLCEGNTKMDLEGNHDFKWIDRLFLVVTWLWIIQVVMLFNRLQLIVFKITRETCYADLLFRFTL